MAMINNDDDFKNALPSESGERPESDRPRELHTQNDGAEPLTRAEADIAGVSSTAKSIYGEDSLDPNAAERKDRFEVDEERIV